VTGNATTRNEEKMLKNENITVWVYDNKFQVQDLDPVESARITDEIAEKNKDKGRTHAATIHTMELFAKRLVGWKLDQECNDENKRAFFRQFTEISIEIMKEANELLKEKRKEILENLFTGASGT
jgi:ABC-type phosphate/phosphonate transport system ATPase subunit